MCFNKGTAAEANQDVDHRVSKDALQSLVAQIWALGPSEVFLGHVALRLLYVCFTLFRHMFLGVMWDPHHGGGRGMEIGGREGGGSRKKGRGGQRKEEEGGIRGREEEEGGEGRG